MEAEKSKKDNQNPNGQGNQNPNGQGNQAQNQDGTPESDPTLLAQLRANLITNEQDLVITSD